MRKLKLILSDFHLGKGKRLPNGAMNPLEDFFHDDRFKEFLEHYSQGIYDDSEIEIILNGDILNLIQIDYHGHFTAVITEGVSSAKLKTIIDGHPVFFKSLKNFLNHPKRSLTYVIGNHDQEMLWKTTRAMFEEAVGKEVNWKNTYHQVDGIHIEHGHQYEAVNRVDPTRLFLTEDLPEPILNLPWGTLFTIQFIVRLKLVRPAIDKVRPFRLMIWWSLVHDTWMALVQGVKLASYFISTRFSKARFRQSNLALTFKILFEASVFPDLSDAAKRILGTPEIHTVVFGHTHVYKQMPIGDEKQYLNTGSWTDIISLDLENFARRSRLTYVRVEYDETGKQVTPLLRHWIGRIPLEEDAFGL
jgi:UDP-2,3-diacylglucosamine pyrophosphatase LpxH